jgi:hypothetical protein
VAPRAGVATARRLVTLTGVLVLHAALVVWLTWPLAAHSTTHLPDTWRGCRFDALHLTWALAHQSRALVTAPWQLFDANAYYPTPHALFYVDGGFGALPLFAPVFLSTGNPTLAINFTLLAGIVLTATALHLVVLRWTGSWLAGLIAAWTVLTTRWVLWTWIPVAPNYAVLFYLPVIVLLAAKDAAPHKLAPLVVLQGLASPYLAAATLAPLGALACGRGLRPSTRGAALRLVAALGVAGVALLVANAGYLLVHRTDAHVARQSVWAASALFPMPLPWGLVAPDAASAVPLSALVLVLTGGLVAARARWRREPVAARDAWMHGALWVVVGLVASLTPVVRWFDAEVALPHRLLADWLPIYDIIRFPNRLAVAALIGMAILAGVAFAECVGRLRTRALSLPVAALVMAVMYAQYAGGFRAPGIPLMAPLPRVYPIWEPPAGDSALVALLRRPGGPVLELPIGQVSGPDSANDAPLQARAMFRSIFHRRPILNGYGGYWPEGFPERMALARRLPDAQALGALRATTGLAMILVHPRLYGAVEREVCRMLERRGRTAERCHDDFGVAERAAWRALAAGGDRPDLRLVATEGDDLLFAVTPVRN